MPKKPFRITNPVFGRNQPKGSDDFVDLNDAERPYDSNPI